MAVTPKRNPLVSIIEPDGTEIQVHPIDAIEITRNGLGKYKNIAQAPAKVQEELQRIERQVASAVTPATASTDTPSAPPQVAPPVEADTQGEDSPDGKGDDSEGEETAPAPKLKRKGQATAGTKEG